MKSSVKPQSQQQQQKARFYLKNKTEKCILNSFSQKLGNPGSGVAAGTQISNTHEFEASLGYIKKISK
jgi:hypothetical protein